jgi:hypothetical protein
VIRYYRRVIKVRAEDSPNVRFALAQMAAGIAPTLEVLVPGLVTYTDYLHRRATWLPERQCVGLDAEFYEGPEQLLFPPAWLNRANEIAARHRGMHRTAKGIGIDPAEGGDKTSMAAVDQLGLIELSSKKTPDTSVITGEAIAFMRKHGVSPERVCFDRGGGGKEHADRLRQMGYNVKTVAFGEQVTLELRRSMVLFPERLDNREEKYAYVNRRAEMYGELSLLLDPASEGPGFAIPAFDGGVVFGRVYEELRHQLSAIPRKWDNEGRMRLPPKNRAGTGDRGEKSLVEIIGHSPDEADALVLAVHAMTHKVVRATAGVS